jgi:Protein of unknown function (DUF998)
MNSKLLVCGVIAGPLCLAVVLVHAFTRDGFDLSRHPISLLSLGELGWIQIANFVLTGLLFVACGFGMRRALPAGRGGTWGSVRLVIATAIQFGFVAVLAPSANCEPTPLPSCVRTL